MIGVVLMLVPTIFITGAMNPASANYLSGMFFRILAALGIIDGTLSILTIIFYRLHIHKYPKAEDSLASTWGDPNTLPKAKEGRGLSIWVWILIIYLAIQIFFPILGMIMFGLF